MNPWWKKIADDEAATSNAPSSQQPNDKTESDNDTKADRGSDEGAQDKVAKDNVAKDNASADASPAEGGPGEDAEPATRTRRAPRKRAAPATKADDEKTESESDGDKDDELEVYRELAGILADAGVELIALEMMEETAHAPLAIEAAMETGLPVWLGVSCKLHPESGEVVSFGPQSIPFGRLLDRLLETPPAVVNLMHSEIGSIPEALSILQESWDGPIGVYPESGYFVKPTWNFVDVISPEDLVKEAKGWVAAGARLLGGCCGTGPEHIEALAAAQDELMAARR